MNFWKRKANAFRRTSTCADIPPQRWDLHSTRGELCLVRSPVPSAEAYIFGVRPNPPYPPTGPLAELEAGTQLEEAVEDHGGVAPRPVVHRHDGSTREVARTGSCPLVHVTAVSPLPFCQYLMPTNRRKSDILRRPRHQRRSWGGCRVAYIPTHLRNRGHLLPPPQVTLVPNM